MSVDVLPNSIPREGRGAVMHRGSAWVPIYCANCGVGSGQFVSGSMFAHWLCDPCAEKWQPLEGVVLIPDEVFWAKVNEAQLEQDGRILSGDEIVEALKDEHHYLTKLARERPTR